MKIIAFAGSNSKESINKKLVSYTCSLIEDASIELLDLNDYEVPLYSIDRENENGFPEKIIEFVEKFEKADKIIISLAEHNGSYTVAFKNIMDWSSRYKLKFFNDLPLFLMATSPGGYGGGNVLAAAKNRLPKFNASIQAEFSLSNFGDNFKEGSITDSELNGELKKKVTSFLNE